ncbi:hypothetical protein RRG08_040707 [Elysia crispata]|uniref:TMC domain-containing protein n=1 Tax=Elysia crispata TaxID=231223 RepID=A0AAE1AZZ1_9GAST|nr:hypothetical protein RRG08_040707 [Elysia crispata]
MAEGGEKTSLLGGSRSGKFYGSSRSGQSSRGKPETAPEYENFGFRKNNDTFPQIAHNSSGDSDMAKSLPSNFGSNRPVSKEELLFNLKFAHLNSGTDWLSKIVAASGSDPDDPHICHHIKATLKDFPLTMSEKKQLSQRLKNFIETNKRPGGNEMSAYVSQGPSDLAVQGSGAKSASCLAQGSGSLLPSEVWTANITKISAYFGSYVASHFRFLRFLVMLNLLLGLVMMAFVSLPHLINGGFEDNDAHGGFFGKLSKSVFFYGAFHKRGFSREAFGITWSYNSPLAYFLTWCSVYFIALIVIVACMFLRYRRIKQMDYSRENPYSSHLLVGWDYCLTNKEGSTTRSRAISTSLKELMTDEKNRAKEKRLSRKKVVTFRVLGNLFNLGVLAASAYLIILVAQATLHFDDFASDELTDFIQQYELTLVVMAMKLIIPPVLSLLMRFEYYSPRTQVKIEIARTALFYVGSLIGFLVSTYNVAKDCRSKSENGTDPSANITMFDVSTEEPPYCCWENKVGEQILQLVFLDLIAHIFIRLGKTLILAISNKYFNFDRFGKPNFDVSRLNLDLLYGQCLVWLGVYFMPLLPLLVAVNQVIIFYLTYCISLTCLEPPPKVFRASRSGTFDLFVLAASLFLCMMPMGVGIMQLEPSASCGLYQPDARVYDSLIDKIGGFPGWLRETVDFMSTPPFILPVTVVLVFLVLYYHAKSVSHKREAENLRDYLNYTNKVENRRMLAFDRGNKGYTGSLPQNLDGGKKEQSVENQGPSHSSTSNVWLD